MNKNTLKGTSEDISLPEHIEGKSVTVEASVEKTKTEKERSERQKEFEFKAKHAEPKDLAAQKKEDFKKNLLKWILVGIITISIILLGFSLL